MLSVDDVIARIQEHSPERVEKLIHNKHAWPVFSVGQTLVQFVAEYVRFAREPGHTAECYAAAKRNIMWNYMHRLDMERYLRQWPHVCRACWGAGAYYFSGNFYEPPSTDVCEDCVGRGVCARCGVAVAFEDDVTVCPACGWDVEAPDSCPDSGTDPLECICGKWERDLWAMREREWESEAAEAQEFHRDWQEIQPYEF